MAQNTDEQNSNEDNRHNTKNITGDKALDEIEFYIDKYKELEGKFNRKRKGYEFVAIFTLSFSILLASFIYSPFLYGKDILTWGYLRLGTSILLSISLVTLFVNYFISRLKGHTRAWSRNRLMREQLEILNREYRLAINEKEPVNEGEFIKIEQENALARLFELESKNRIETHKDIVGDYLAAHEGTFNWVKGLRK